MVVPRRRSMEGFPRAGVLRQLAHKFALNDRHCASMPFSGSEFGGGADVLGSQCDLVEISQAGSRRPKSAPAPEAKLVRRHACWVHGRPSLQTRGRPLSRPLSLGRTPEHPLAPSTPNRRATVGQLVCSGAVGRSQGTQVNRPGGGLPCCTAGWLDGGGSGKGVGLVKGVDWRASGHDAGRASFKHVASVAFLC